MYKKIPWRRLFLKKEPPIKLQLLKETKPLAHYNSVNLYCLDESRFGLMAPLRRILTLRGIKPLLPYQHRFENFYLFGAFSPITGSDFLLELPTCNTEGFQLYLNEFTKQGPEEFKIILLDNGAFHHSKALVIAHNIALLFLPPYAPALNPAEKIWRHLKDYLVNTLFETLEHLSDKLQHIIQTTLLPTTITSITSFNHYSEAFIQTFNV